jgi:hypothetical protein
MAYNDRYRTLLIPQDNIRVPAYLSPSSDLELQQWQYVLSPPVHRDITLDDLLWLVFETAGRKTLFDSRNFSVYKLRVVNLKPDGAETGSDLYRPAGERLTPTYAPISSKSINIVDKTFIGIFGRA